MKNLFTITDSKIIAFIILFFVGGFILLTALNPAKAEKVNEKNFTGINAVGQIYINGELTGTIINH